MTADSKPPKPAIKSSTLPRTSSQERDRLKPAPPMKQGSIQNQYQHLTLAPEVYNHLRGLQKKTKDLKSEVKTLRRLAQSQAIAVREDIKDTFMRIRATLLATSGSHWGQNDQERTRISREEEIYKQEVIRLEKDLADLEGSVEVLRGEVINRRTRVNMAAVEDMALVLSRASKTVAELKMRFPSLQQNLRNILSTEMDRVCREEKFLKEEPDRLEIALRRCKKLTGTLVTLKRLASVQEQRTCVEPTAPEESSPRSASETTNSTNKPIPSPRLGGGQAPIGLTPENALDILLDELQTFAKPPNPNDQLQIRPDESTTSDDSSQTLQNTVTTKLSQSQLYPDSAHQLRRLHSYPSGSDTEESPPRPPPLAAKPPVPERNSELLSRQKGKKVPPPPPPRTSSRSPLASPTSPSMTNRIITEHQQQQQQLNAEQQFINSINNNNQFIQNDQDSGSESANSQDNNSQRQMQLELRHQELLKKQKQLQEQYQRLQQMSKNAIPLGHNDNVKRMGSDTNLSQKLNADKVNDNVPQSQTTVTTNKVYETDIL
ncbi:hypothetical protein PVAND_011855 [Polypedilum vanderplanki]|uniref:Actin interacting protein 3-like C-terminal domain-containing protein n=1 Tax=Polypedilum vanderplanki TaxID=319348 RepID=A0A9J6CJW1_POLVA|nr:hypothetical protein PVAND_011855 [Polypedilum vanderplanki]